jgi:hypothetical protein
VRNGIGITYGDVVVGNIGSNSKLDHTLIGDTVNASARIESLTKSYRLGMLVSEWVRDKFTGNVATRFIDLTTVKGMTSPIRIYEVYEHEPDWIKDKKLYMEPDMETAFELYAAGQFDEASTLYGHLKRAIGPHRYYEGLCADPVLDFFADRCAHISKQVAGGAFSLEEWDGVYRPFPDNTHFDSPS